MWYIHLLKHIYYILYNNIIIVIIIVILIFNFEIGIRCAIWNPQQQSCWDILRTFLCFLRCMGRAEGRALPWTSREFGKGGTCMACFVWKNLQKNHICNATTYMQVLYLRACLLFVRPMHIWHVCCLFNPCTYDMFVVCFHHAYTVNEIGHPK